MKRTYILLVVAATLTLSLVSVEIAATEDPGSKPGIAGGQKSALVGHKPGASSGDVYSVAGSNTIRGGQEGNEFRIAAG